MNDSPSESDDEKYKTSFMNALYKENYIPQVEELLESVRGESNYEELHDVYLDARRKFQEDMWEALVKVVPKKALEDTVKFLVEHGTLSEDFYQNMTE